MKRYQRSILAVLSDTHAGHRLGLCNPETELHDEDIHGNIVNTYHPQMSETASVIWELHSNHVNEVINLVGKDELHLMHLGDLTQGNAFNTELISTRKADQPEIAVWNFYPWFKFKNLKTLWIDKGTKVHNFGEATAEIYTTKSLKREFPKVDTKTMFHGLLNYKGILIDHAHHGPATGKRNWLAGNEARLYLKSLMKDELDHGKIPPHLVLRGHRHFLIEEHNVLFTGDKRYESKIFGLPSYCGFGEYTTQITLSYPYLTNGMIAFEILNGQIYQTHFFIQTVDIRTQETVE